MKRRTILRWSVSFAATWPFWKISVAAQTPRATLSDAQLATLRAVARVVLPSTLTAAQADASVAGFRQWLAGYRSGAEISHGYGILRTRVTPTISPDTYARQLDALERAAVGGDFAALQADRQRELIESALATAKIADLPPIPNGGHIVSDFMSFYFGRSEANDLAYGAKIGRETCRGLTGSSSEPPRLTEG